MIRYINLLNRLPWSDFVIKYPVIPFVEHHSTVTSFLFIQSVIKNNHMFMGLVLLLPEALPLFSISMPLWLYC